MKERSMPTPHDFKPDKFLFVGDSEELIAAHEIILGERAIPPDTDRAAHLHQCWALLRSAMELADTRYEDRDSLRAKVGR